MPKSNEFYYCMFQLERAQLEARRRDAERRRRLRRTALPRRAAWAEVANLAGVGRGITGRLASPTATVRPTGA